MTDILSRRQVKCPSHPYENVVLVCTECRCPQNSLLCRLCLEGRSLHAEHESKVRPLAEAVRELAEQISRSSHLMDEFQGECYKSKDFSQIMKLHLEAEGHYRQLEKHIKSQKEELNRCIEELHLEFRIRLDSFRDQSVKRIDQFFSDYVLSQDTLRKLLEPVRQFSASFRHYCNPTTFALKVITEPGTRPNDWLRLLKNNLSFSANIEPGRESFKRNITKSLDHLSAMLQNLPSFRSKDQSNDLNQFLLRLEGCLNCKKFPQLKRVLNEAR